MQARADDAGVKLRPHIKTHKSVAIAKLQRASGASGITVAKVSEAEVFAAAGFEDIRIAYCVVGADKIRRVSDVAQLARTSFCVDTVAGAEQASAVLEHVGVEVDVLIEVDTGQGRTGVPWDDDEALVELAKRVDALPGIRLIGLLTHGGFGYYGPKDGETSEQALRRAAVEEQDRVSRAAGVLRDAGYPPEEVSIGSTPTLRFLGRDKDAELRFTEVRPGNYVFHDCTQVGLGVAAWKDCALSVLTTVVSRRRDHDGTERVYLDAGKKVLTSDTAFGFPGYGQILYNARTMVPLPHAEIVGLSEEHAWVKVRGGSTLDVGDRVRVVPNHACVVANMLTELHVVDGEDVVGLWSVDARGCVQ